MTKSKSNIFERIIQVKDVEDGKSSYPDFSCRRSAENWPTKDTGKTKLTYVVTMIGSLVKFLVIPYWLSTDSKRASARELQSDFKLLLFLALPAVA